MILYNLANEEVALRLFSVCYINKCPKFYSIAPLKAVLASHIYATIIRLSMISRPRAMNHYSFINK